MKAIIVGGGIGGLSAALCLAKRNVHVVVFEQASEFGEIGAGIQLSPNCTRVLHHLGLEPALRGVAFIPEGTEMRDWKSGKVISRNELGTSVIETYGYPYYHVHRADLMRVLADAAGSSPNIDLYTDACVEKVEEKNEFVSVLHDGQSFTSDFLVGADGIHSVVRRRLFGNESPIFTGNVAWRGLVPAERLPNGLVRPVAAAWWGPGKHFVHYYVRGGELLNCVCVVEKEGWDIESWTEKGDHAELASDFAGWHDTIETLIANMDKDSCYKWALYDRPPMRQWGRDRITLLGDACHPTLPFMAQGAAMAIEDGAVLAACVSSASDVPSALQKYEDLRRERTAQIQLGSRRNAEIFHARGLKAVARNAAAGVAGGRVLDRLFRYDALTAHEG